MALNLLDTCSASTCGQLCLSVSHDAGGPQSGRTSSGGCSSHSKEPHPLHPQNEACEVNSLNLPLRWAFCFGVRHGPGVGLVTPVLNPRPSSARRVLCLLLSELGLWALPGETHCLCCVPRKGGAAASQQSVVTPRGPARRRPSGTVEGPHLSFGSSDNQPPWSSKLSIAPGERGWEFLAAFSYLPNPFGGDGFYFQ